VVEVDVVDVLVDVVLVEVDVVLVDVDVVLVEVDVVDVLVVETFCKASSTASSICACISSSEGPQAINKDKKTIKTLFIIVSLVGGK
tara:strand:- start:30 stop:290 length:261 start_codon:yes stop_codon:yes gene_type:complete